MIHVPFILVTVQALPNEASTRDGAKQLDHKERPLKSTTLYGPCKLCLFNLPFFPGKRLQSCKNSDSSKIPDEGNGGSLTTEHVKRTTHSMSTKQCQQFDTSTGHYTSKCSFSLSLS